MNCILKIMRWFSINSLNVISWFKIIRWFKLFANTKFNLLWNRVVAYCRSKRKIAHCKGFSVCYINLFSSPTRYGRYIYCWSKALYWYAPQFHKLYAYPNSIQYRLHNSMDLGAVFKQQPREIRWHTGISYIHIYTHIICACTQNLAILCDFPWKLFCSHTHTWNINI